MNEWTNARIYCLPPYLIRKWTGRGFPPHCPPTEWRSEKLNSIWLDGGRELSSNDTIFILATHSHISLGRKHIQTIRVQICGEDMKIVMSKQNACKVARSDGSGWRSAYRKGDCAWSGVAESTANSAVSPSGWCSDIEGGGTHCTWMWSTTDDAIV